MVTFLDTLYLKMEQASAPPRLDDVRPRLVLAQAERINSNVPVAQAFVYEGSPREGDEEQLSYEDEQELEAVVAVPATSTKGGNEKKGKEANKEKKKSGMFSRFSSWFSSSESNNGDAAAAKPQYDQRRTTHDAVELETNVEGLSSVFENQAGISMEKDIDRGNDITDDFDYFRGTHTGHIGHTGKGKEREREAKKSKSSPISTPSAPMMDPEKAAALGAYKDSNSNMNMNMHQGTEREKANTKETKEKGKKETPQSKYKGRVFDGSTLVIFGTHNQWRGGYSGYSNSAYKANNSIQHAASCQSFRLQIQRAAHSGAGVGVGKSKGKSKGKGSKTFSATATDTDTDTTRSFTWDLVPQNMSVSQHHRDTITSLSVQSHKSYISCSRDACAIGWSADVEGGELCLRKTFLLKNVSASNWVRQYWIMGYVVCLDGCISVLLLSCSITTGALESPSLLLSCSIVTISLHITITIILIITLASFCLSTSAGDWCLPRHRNG